MLSLCVIARNEAIQRTSIPLDCFVVPPRNDVIASELELHELRYCRRAVGIADVDEVDTVDKFVDIK